MSFRWETPSSSCSKWLYIQPAMCIAILVPLTTWLDMLTMTYACNPRILPIHMARRVVSGIEMPVHAADTWLQFIPADHTAECVCRVMTTRLAMWTYSHKSPTQTASAHVSCVYCYVIYNFSFPRCWPLITYWKHVTINISPLHGGHPLNRLTVSEKNSSETTDVRLLGPESNKKLG